MSQLGVSSFGWQPIILFHPKKGLDFGGGRYLPNPTIIGIQNGSGSPGEVGGDRIGTLIGIEAIFSKTPDQIIPLNLSVMDEGVLDTIPTMERKLKG